jgi:hypothetical protein
LKTGVSSRQKNSAERYHVDAEQRQRGLEDQVGHDDGAHQLPHPPRLVAERPGQVAGDEHERRHVPGVEEVVEVVLDGGLRQQRPRVADDDQQDQRHLGVVEPRVPRLRGCGRRRLRRGVRG